MQELSFTTPLDLAFELKEDSVIIYFYSFIVVYDRATQELHCYTIPEGAAVNSGLYKQLMSKKFVVGNCVYNCEQGFEGYIKLTRNNGGQEQVLIEMPGTVYLLGSVILPGCASGIIIMLIIVWYQKRKRHKNTQDNFREQK